MARSVVTRAAASIFALGVVAFASKSHAQYVGVDLYTMNPPTGLAFPSAANEVAAQAGQVGGESVVAVPGGNGHATLWSSTGAATDLNPTVLSGYDASAVWGIGGGQQVGTASGLATGPISSEAPTHAMLWNGTADSAVDLHPGSISGIVNSLALATDGSHQVGYYNDSGGNHALLWSGTAGSVAQLQPTKFSAYIFSVAFGVNGNQQVGTMLSNQGAGSGSLHPQHAVLWTGSAASAVDLHPTSLPTTYDNGSTALSAGGGQQVGWASFSIGLPYYHAMVWSGTSASAVDLNPQGADNSEAVGTNGSIQVGFTTRLVNNNPTPSAYMWTGTAVSATNLQFMLPSGTVQSTAYSVNAAGDIFGVSGDNTGKYHAVEWIAPAHAATGSIGGGSNQTTTAAGRSPTSGDVKVTFPSASGGTFTNTNSLTTTSILASQTVPFNFALPTASGLAQEWDLSFDGTFTGLATLTFHYDPSTLSPGVDPSTLEIEHFTNGQWVALSGVVDPVADTITISTNSFSPFVLAAVPEPSALAVLSLAGASVLRRKRGM